MQRSPYLIAAALFVASLAVAVHLGSGTDAFSQGSGVVLGLGFLIFATIGVAGLLLSRGRWARRLALALGLAVVTTAALTSPWSWASIAAVVAGALAIGGTTGRWLDGWIRQRPTPDGPGPRIMALVLGLIGLVPAVALAEPDDITTWHGILAGAGIFFGWAYSRAEIWALWAIRIALPLLAIPALLRSPPAGAFFLGAGVIALTALAWMREARLAVQPLMDQLPGPRVLDERQGG